MASIRKRYNHYQARIARKGKPEVARTFKTKAEAIAWAETIEGYSSASLKDYLEGEKLILYAAFERYEDEVSVFKKGHVQEKSKIKHWKQSELATKSLVSITSSDIAAHRDLRVKQNIAANTIRLELAVLSHLFETARKEWGFEKLDNPVKLVRRLRLPKGRDRRINDEEEAYKLFQSCKEFGGQLLYNIVRFAIETAMRRSEIISLTWEDINLNARIAHLRETKNGDSRTVPLSSKAIEILRSQQEANKTGKVFQVSIDWISQRFCYCCRKAGIEGLRFHDLRHEATTRLFEKGLSMMEVSTVTGHKSLSMLKRYTHLKASELALRLG